ncbi:hypothetical protein D3OALGA1CA_790 [Olavius algarvensis associated proteobacterium Delta 3]|nr:hypothetical protein D3OALGA1CA_790 [Olavius algarvensis associated proteobacterium Delta 3]
MLSVFDPCVLMGRSWHPFMLWVLVRALHQMESFMSKALRGDAVVQLPRASNNAGHGSFRLARRGKSFQGVLKFSVVTNCTAAENARTHHNTTISLFFSQMLKRFHAMFGLETNLSAEVPGNNPRPFLRVLFLRDYSIKINGPCGNQPFFHPHRASPIKGEGIIFSLPWREGASGRG